MEKYNTIPSPKDDRDWVIESLPKINILLPETVDHTSYLQPIRNQEKESSCAAHVASCIKEWQEYLDIGFYNYMSPQFIYNLRENQNCKEMHGRDVMKILLKKGCCYEITYPNINIEPPENIGIDALVQAHKFRIKGYAQIKTIHGLKMALALNGPCYISFPVYNNTDFMWKSNNNQKSKGGHALTVVGYNNIGFKLRNSWGENWGIDGYCLYPYSDWGSHWEIWTVMDENSFYYNNTMEVIDPKKVNCCSFLFKKKY